LPLQRWPQSFAVKEEQKLQAIGPFLPISSFLNCYSLSNSWRVLSKCIKTHKVVVATSSVLHKAAFLACNDA